MQKVKTFKAYHWRKTDYISIKGLFRAVRKAYPGARVSLGTLEMHVSYASAQYIFDVFRHDDGKYEICDISKLDRTLS